MPRLQPCISVNSARTARRTLRVRASGDDENKTEKETKAKEGRYSKMVEELAKTGMTPAKAKVDSCSSIAKLTSAKHKPTT